MTQEELIAYLGALLRRAQEYVGTETQAEALQRFVAFAPSRTKSDLLRLEADKLDRRDALIREIRAALYPVYTTTTAPATANVPAIGTGSATGAQFSDYALR